MRQSGHYFETSKATDIHSVIIVASSVARIATETQHFMLVNSLTEDLLLGIDKASSK